MKQYNVSAKLNKIDKCAEDKLNKALRQIATKRNPTPSLFLAPKTTHTKWYKTANGAYQQCLQQS